MPTSDQPPTVNLGYRPRLADMRHPGTSDPSAARAEAVSSETAAAERASRPRTSPPERFGDRTGYAVDFLEGFPVPLPEPLGARARDVTPVEGRSDGRLDYQNFSVVMSTSRRMAMFTAVNIHGARSVSLVREDDKWALDGRIPRDAQLGEDLYAGNRLDRGHLVRREDPNWGDGAEIANDDTFHFTNCAPQIDVMNQKTWLGLENYILQNARAWKAECTVFTGPVFTSNDLPYRDALIPKSFWKVIAFLSDTGLPSATAYVVEQDRELTLLEAAFGAYKTYQRSVRQIEALTGLSFGRLSEFDGFSNEEAIDGTLSLKSEIRVLSDIRV